MNDVNVCKDMIKILRERYLSLDADLRIVKSRYCSLVEGDPLTNDDCETLMNSTGTFIQNKVH